MNKSQHYEDVAIIADEALCDFAGNRQVLVPKGTTKVFEHLQSRTFRSYCLEFCGQYELAFARCKFTSGKKELEMDRKVLDACEIHVSDVEEGGEGLQRALARVLVSGEQADLKLVLREDVFNVHRGILMARSPKFKTMLSSSLKEGSENKVSVLSDCSVAVFRQMLQWIYSGRCALPDDVFEVCKLLTLADEYLLNDLVSVCEEDIVYKLDASNVVRIITQDGVVVPEKCEQKIFAECEGILLSQFSIIYEADPEVEKKLVSVPGLITKILLHANEAGGPSRKGTKERTAKKRVRFNLSKSESMTHAETHSFIDTDNDRSGHSVGHGTESDTQSFYSLFNNNDPDEESERPVLESPKNLDLND